MTQYDGGSDFESGGGRKPPNRPRDAVLRGMTEARDNLSEEVRWNAGVNGRIIVGNAKLWSTDGVRLKNLRRGQEVQILGQKGDGYIARLKDGSEGLIVERAIELDQLPPGPEREETEEQLRIRSTLLAVGTWSIPDQTEGEIGLLRDPLDVGLRVAHRHRLAPFSRAQDIASRPGMKRIEEATPYYRLVGVGMIDNRRPENDPRYAYCFEHTEQVIREITERLNASLREQGFPDSFWVRPFVRGLSRSEIFQRALAQNNPWATASTSPHEFGHTFDLHRNRYDILDYQGNFVTSTIFANDPLNNALRLSPKINAVLGRVLIAMKGEGKISVIHEGRNAVYHISDMHPVGESAIG
jgi:hypothetical protein